MTYIESLNALDPVTRRDIKPSNPETIQGSALIKCMNCGVPKAREAFYISKTQRASPYCIACNAVAALKAKYRRELKREGVQGFTRRIERKEYQLDLMLKAVVEFQKQEGEI